MMPRMRSQQKLTHAFAASLDELPAHWPRTNWQRREIRPDAVDFVSGDFTIHFIRTGDDWRVAGREAAPPSRPRLWWLWLIAGLASTIGGVIGILVDHNSSWLGGGAVGLVVSARGFFQQARPVRRGERRVATPPL
jgi:hypothetical protein